MANFDTTSPVMVTGSTGYVAGVLCKELLKAGLTVHLSCERDPTNESKIQHLKDIEANSDGTLRFFRADLLDDGSYLESMKDCSTVFDSASPFSMSVPKGKEIEILLDPAIKGTKNVLQLDETAVVDYKAVRVSKTLAEKAAWEFVKDKDCNYELIVINPGFVMGPGIMVHPTSESYQFVQRLGNGVMKYGCPNTGIVAVDVRDVAKAHFNAGFTENVNGRYLVWILWLIAPLIGMTRTYVWRAVNVEAGMDNSKSIRGLNMEYKPLNVTMQDMFIQMVDDGFVNDPTIAVKKEE
ncbi:NAD(P)-binding protein [Fragilariopsis cylindrus CCMP1102]|uniref:NAD(P)-binding protein n=1 Tax=Fragilariopsis cylindrus CCMP1102 TaxID=635003 RepID=A0A1E7EKG9_9STRA|nr:NAD(P)-binding protein [Fragilariopsis cylindrus CCMP1102]|eukprot:OEU06415.1 NAD(P)-binding protein [Fragilariopsis cylindrus CCMP1102]